MFYLIWLTSLHPCCLHLHVPHLCPASMPPMCPPLICLLNSICYFKLCVLPELLVYLTCLSPARYLPVHYSPSAHLPLTLCYPSTTHLLLMHYLHPIHVPFLPHLHAVHALPMCYLHSTHALSAPLYVPTYIAVDTKYICSKIIY